MTQLEIYNAALVSIGASPVTATTEASKEAETCNIYWSLTQDIVMSTYAWPSCTKRAKLINLSAVEKLDYAYAYALPSDFLMLIEVLHITAYSPEMYSIECGNILTNEQSPQIKYIYRNTDTTTYETGLTELLILHLSYQIAYAIQGKETRSDMQLQKYMLKLNEIRTRISRHKTNEPIGNDYMLWERY